VCAVKRERDGHWRWNSKDKEKEEEENKGREGRRKHEENAVLGACLPCPAGICPGSWLD
jgi:hypothetical protein